MNMSNNDYQEQDFEYTFKGERKGDEDKNSRQRRMNYAQARRPAVSHNGIHRRRNKRFAW